MSYHYLPIIYGRKAEQEPRLMKLFERIDAEFLVVSPVHADTHC